MGWVLMGRPSAKPEAVDAFRVDVSHPHPRTVVVAVHGDVDLRVAGEFEDTLRSVLEGSPSALVVDFSDTTFLDSMALGVLLGATKRLRDGGGRLRVVAPGIEVRRIFEITGLDRVFDLERSRSEALRAAG